MTTTPLPEWVPRSVQVLYEGYSVKAFSSDLLAGVTVGLVALPLAMAFAISSGLTPQAGIYCAIITGFLISALGGSRFQIGAISLIRSIIQAAASNAAVRWADDTTITTAVSPIAKRPTRW